MGTMVGIQQLLPISNRFPSPSHSLLSQGLNEMPSIEQNVLSEAKSHTILHGSMSADSGQLSLIVGSTGFWFVFVLSLHALQRLGSWVLRFVTADDRSLAHGYEDQDGDATDESVRNASKQSLQLAILPIVSLGTVISALETGLTAHQSVHSAGFVRWTDIGTWVCTFLQRFNSEKE